MKRRWRAIRPRILPKIGLMIVGFLAKTVRVHVEGYDQYRHLERGVIFAGWHGKTLIPAMFFRNQGVWTIISRSRDGEMQNEIFTKLGFKTIRGSTGRNGAKAAAESIRVLKKGEVMAFTPDGPRGPSGIVQPGVVLMAKKSGAALVPVGVSATRKWHAPTWDSYMVPLPFSKSVMVFGEPLFVSRDASDEEAELARKKLEEEIHKVQARADSWFKKR